MTPPDSFEAAPVTGPPTPSVSPAALRLAQEAVKQFPGCFWFWPDDVRIETAEDVMEVMRQLRLNGGRDAWQMAACITKCR